MSKVIKRWNNLRLKLISHLKFKEFKVGNHRESPQKGSL